MIRFYLNRELSTMFGVKLSRWKRWSREFLPPDPLGGLQSGFARQYSLPEAFQVYLGGHLVADLKFSIPKTKIILADLKEWVTTQFFSYTLPEKQSLVQKSVKEYRIYIFMNLEATQTVPEHSYMIRRVIDQEKSHGKGARIVTERYIENWLKEGEPGIDPDRSDSVPYWMAARILYITKVYQNFTELLRGEGNKGS
jgi:hypothetical protein